MIAPSATWDALAEAVLTHDLPMQRAEWVPEATVYEVVYEIGGRTYYERRDTLEAAQWVDTVVRGNGGVSYGWREIPADLP